MAPDGEEDMDRKYIEMAIRKYEKIRSAVCKGKKANKIERELVSLVFNKMVDPYYYWDEAMAKAESEGGNGTISNTSGTGDISEIAMKYDLDCTEQNGTPSRIRVKRFIDVGFRELRSEMARMGYSYDRESRSFVKWVRK